MIKIRDEFLISLYLWSNPQQSQERVFCMTTLHLLQLQEWIKFVQDTNYQPEDNDGYLSHLLSEPQKIAALLKQPVINVSIQDVLQYCKHNSARLPTEKELSEFLSKKQSLDPLWYATHPNEEDGTSQALGAGTTYYSTKTGEELRYPFQHSGVSPLRVSLDSRFGSLAFFIVYTENPIISMWKNQNEDGLYDD